MCDNVRVKRAQQSGLIAFLLIIFGFVSVALSQTYPYTVLHTFAGGPADGAHPQGSLVQSGGNLYGMTPFGGSSDNGILFSLNPATKVHTIIHTFSGAVSDGATPFGSLTALGPTLYGTAGGTGTNHGIIFSVDPTTNAYAVRYTFAGGTADGSGPQDLVGLGATLAGMTYSGGANDSGTIFTFNPTNNTETLWHSFGTIFSSDPRYPHAALTVTGNVPGESDFYAMTPMGGATGVGTLFSYNSNTDALTVQKSFGYGSPNGTAPLGALYNPHTSHLYGMTEQGGSGGTGNLFDYNQFTGSLNTLHTFSGGPSDGAYPDGSLIPSSPIPLAPNWVLYGMTTGGGANDKGTIFSCDPHTGTFTILHSFSGLDGAFPYGSLVLSGNTLYGMTQSGGSAGDGVIFSLTVPEPLSVAAFLYPLLLLSRSISRQGFIHRGRSAPN